MAERSALQRAREQRRLTQEEVADELRRLGLQHGHGELGVDANAVSRHERGVIGMPRAPYPALYAVLYEVPVGELWPVGTMSGMDRRTFLQAVAAASGGALLPGGDDLDAMLAITSGLRRLEATTPVAALRAPVLAHLRLVGQRADRGPGYAAAAAEVARFAAFMAWDQDDHQHARGLYGRAVGYAERSRSDVLTAYMRGSWALWAAETGQGAEARRIERQVRPTPAISPWISTMRATVASSVGDADTTLAGLRDAARALEAEPAPPDPGIYPLTPAKLQGYVGRCYVRLGLHKAAVPTLQEALDGMPRTKQRAVLLLDLAHALGDGDEARELAAEARQIGQEFQSRKVLARIAA
jgi:transcriptional regulator with XRE-family HTH domain